jgi:mono/diheme cytochrome c family protein
VPPVKLFLVFLIGCFLVSAVASPARVGSGPQEATPAAPSIEDRLTPPFMPEHPTQADRGHFVYYQVCMACHGDRGQGLTDEWRAQYGPKDMNCWQSRCHSFNHPPQGFQLVKTIPAVLGPGALNNYNNAQQLHDYIVNTMPWWNPGYLSADEFWQITAFLMRELGALPEGAILEEGTAVVYLLRPTNPLPRNDRLATLLVALILIFGGGFVLYPTKAA